MTQSFALYNVYLLFRFTFLFCNILIFKINSDDCSTMYWCSLKCVSTQYQIYTNSIQINVGINIMLVFLFSDSIVLHEWNTQPEEDGDLISYKIIKLFECEDVCRITVYWYNPFFSFETVFLTSTISCRSRIVLNLFWFGAT